MGQHWPAHCQLKSLKAEQWSGALHQMLRKKIITTSQNRKPLIFIFDLGKPHTDGERKGGDRRKKIVSDSTCPHRAIFLSGANLSEKHLDDILAVSCHSLCSWCLN